MSLRIKSYPYKNGNEYESSDLHELVLSHGTIFSHLLPSSQVEPQILGWLVNEGYLLYGFPPTWQCQPRDTFRDYVLLSLLLVFAQSPTLGDIHPKQRRTRTLVEFWWRWWWFGSSLPNRLDNKHIIRGVLYKSEHTASWGHENFSPYYYYRCHSPANHHHHQQSTVLISCGWLDGACSSVEFLY